MTSLRTQAHRQHESTEHKTSSFASSSWTWYVQEAMFLITYSSWSRSVYYSDKQTDEIPPWKETHPGVAEDVSLAILDPGGKFHRINKFCEAVNSIWGVACSISWGFSFWSSTRPHKDVHLRAILVRDQGNSAPAHHERRRSRQRWLEKVSCSRRVQPAHK